MDENISFYKNCASEFLDPSSSLANGVKERLKKCYDFTKSGEIITQTKSNSEALPELLINNFDLEQIWQQIELQNEPLLTKSLINVSRLIVNKNKLSFKNRNDLNETNEEINEMSVDEEEDNLIDLEDKEDILNENDDLLKSSDNCDDMKESFAQAQTSQQSSIVDDEFFKLREMENFLNLEEKKLNNPDSGNESEDSDSKESIDLFDDFPEDDEDDNGEMAKYRDFFVKKDNEKKLNTKRNKFLEEMSENEDVVDKSTYEMRQERLNKKIDEIESNRVNQKNWQLKGEITAESRPQNSLLEEVVEFDLTTKPAPVITEQTTYQLEDIIKQRIKNKVFDSVERKTKPVETHLEYKPKLVLNQEKSKQSLAQIYEKEYLDQKLALDPENANKFEEEPELHKEINSMMTNLFYQLDSLSNFHFTPKPAVPELKIVNNLPAINMEEVAPVAVSDAAMLAPEEVKNKVRGNIIGKDERTSTDKKRERRKKKQKQRLFAQKNKTNK